MKYVIGIDGGGTKTAYACADENGRILAQSVEGSISYREHGYDGMETRLREGVDHVLKDAALTLSDIDAIAIGIPCYGENKEADVRIEAICKDLFAETEVIPVNDAIVGYYGALSGRCGINIVSGTGSIACGSDASGRTARSGGWSEHFSDEGSCYWLGRQSMHLFCKESDYRIPRGAFYELVRKELGIREDFDFIDIAEKQYLPERSKVASLQKILLEAAEAGDAAAAALYEAACDELVQLAVGVKNQLCFTDTIEVSLTGGLTHAEKFIAGPLKEKLRAQGMCYVPAESSPLEGAVILALKKIR